MMTIEKYIKNIRRKADSALKANLPERKDKVSLGMRYACLGAGKRLRPILFITTLESLGGKINKGVMKIALAIEFIHTFSLIQDDLPSLDNDDYRRGRLTVHKAFGEDIAILASDALLNEAYRIILEDSSIDPVLKVEVAIELMRAVKNLIRGQEKDLGLTKPPHPKKTQFFRIGCGGKGTRISLLKLNEIYLDKTAVLIAACIKIAGILRRAKSEELKWLNSFGEKLGLAYQISDDILNITGDKEAFRGKQFSDQRKGRVTYVSLAGIKRSQEIAENLIREAKKDLEKIDNIDKEKLHCLCDFILKRTY